MSLENPVTKFDERICLQHNFSSAIISSWFTSLTVIFSSRHVYVR